MKTLYITDLDGTLLLPDATLSETSAEILQDLMERGLLFSVATARTQYTVLPILRNALPKLPCVLMNGALIYGFTESRPIKAEYMDTAVTRLILSVLKEFHLTGFLYQMTENKLMVYYENLNVPARRQFYEERVRLYQKPFSQTDDFSLLPEGCTLHISIQDTREALAPAITELKKLADINFTFYKDIYHPGLWYLELFHTNANKCNAVNFIRTAGGYDKIIGFGDNLNDTPLLQACDEFYAVSNAVSDLKQKATAVIGGNADNAVANYMSDRFAKQS